ncbi:MAG: DUF6384 family protein [Pseudomonadota bacterium]
MVDTVEHKKSLDEVLVAMDVVDTLRHRDQTLLKELDRTGRKADLIKRLREIYEAQGIEVPDRVIEQGVKALEEQRFRYTPPEDGFGVWLAKIYVSRKRWWKPFTGIIAAIAIGIGIYQFGIVGPQKARAEAERIELTQTLPDALEVVHQAVLDISESEDANRLAQTYYQDGRSAIQSSDVSEAKAAITSLKTLYDDVAVNYDIRVVYGPNEDDSGFYRFTEDDPQVTNYYLIVEAVRPSGDTVSVSIRSEEDQATARVSRWAQRVSAATFNSVAADKNDDLIIQDALIGRKDSGQLNPDFLVETPGGAILEW